ncbi:MAG TPA: class I SAM-dependent methyltransferase [Deltaproteobacteria bacterium]|jgi:predicted O-methyltransferase YrrM|nr:class I SAM-dependent methyltransferase [Deltaproteobacteria bacterium]
MTLRKGIARIVPSFLKARIFFLEDMKDLKSIKRTGCSTDSIRHRNDISLSDIFHSDGIEAMWADSTKAIDLFAIPDGTGGVNPGDRKALYFLISALKPLSVLEVGTHIGASTIHIASALSMSRMRNGAHSSMTTVDVADVNSPLAKPWVKYGTSSSPLEMIDRLGYGSFVEFVTDTFLHFAEGSSRRFDFIFLDGDHRASTVYQEIPAALSLLNRNGIILLHDYFPGLKPLWSDGSVIPGPFLAAERLKKEGARLTVMPLGELPWPTKLQSNVTSLALLMRDE